MILHLSFILLFLFKDCFFQIYSLSKKCTHGSATFNVGSTFSFVRTCYICVCFYDGQIRCTDYTKCDQIQCIDNNLLAACCNKLGCEREWNSTQRSCKKTTCGNIIVKEKTSSLNRPFGLIISIMIFLVVFIITTICLIKIFKRKYRDIKARPRESNYKNNVIYFRRHGRKL